jgi:hypothetical protein
LIFENLIEVIFLLLSDCMMLQIDLFDIRLNY